MAPIQANWARDNRGVMIRVLGAPGDPTTHLENRAGEPLANPYLFMASQIHAGLDAIGRKLSPGPSADAPYEVSTDPLPATLAEALGKLDASACLRAAFSDRFVDYYLNIKQAEIARFAAAEKTSDPSEVTVWEHNEYFDLA
jgi:glutamine synthetase